MNEKTRLGLYLLFPPFLLWGAVFLFFLDNTLAQYVYERVSANTIGIFVLIAGLIFPGAACYVGVSCLRNKDDYKINLVVTIISVLMLALLAGFLVIFR